jgi:hypothetical protein
MNELSALIPMNGIAGLHGFVARQAAGGLSRRQSPLRRRSGDRLPSARDRDGFYSPVLKPNGVRTMNSTSTADTANSFFQVLTIAMVGLFILAKVAQFIVTNIA